jgi:DNA-binding CsgD family transcriptional regulator
MTAMGLSYAAGAAPFRGDLHFARVRAGEALALLQRTGFSYASFWGPLLALGFLAVSVVDPVSGFDVLEPFVGMIETNGIAEPAMMPFVPEAVEVLVVAGQLDRAGALLDAFEGRSQELERGPMLAASMRCRGLLLAAQRDLDGAVAALEEALLRQEHLRMPFEQARTLLALGQVHRRRKEKRAAGDSLREALAVFEGLGAPLWAQKARDELSRLGLRHGSSSELTASEQRVAELAGGGLTNREVAGALFISPKTVETHLARAYRKLGIHSRAELGARIAELKGRSQTT